ncbi:MAG TPA: hypothetical protein VGO47_08070, partial [Chlamydiales bacterium]|nr:hypothetical protein [Chlamydiales bacterium]
MQTSMVCIILITIILRLVRRRARLRTRERMARIKLYDVLNAKIKGLMLSPLPSDTLMMQHVLKD